MKLGYYNPLSFMFPKHLTVQLFANYSVNEIKIILFKLIKSFIQIQDILKINTKGVYQLLSVNNEKFNYRYFVLIKKLKPN